MLTTVPHLASQEDSVTVQAGGSYAAGWFHETLLGANYRRLWTTPVAFPVLRPDTFAGGLEPVQLGEGRQTRSLRFGARDGQEFVFRSIDKDQTGGLHPDLRGSLIDHIVQDQISAKHPGAALVVAHLLSAAGILHADPRIAVMADHPSLGEFRDEFGGMLGTFEARPTETEGIGRFGGYERLIGTESLLQRLEESPEDRVDASAFLAARLLDILVGDWDRHDDQWRWAQTDVGGRRVWLPIPRDRDNAFFHSAGVLGVVGRAVRPYVIKFEEHYPDLIGLTYNSRNLDRHILPELPSSTWDSVALDLQLRLTNSVIAYAVRQLPAPYYDLSGPDLERKLRVRRDSLPGVARAFYAQITREVDVYATDDADRAEVNRIEDGTVSVRLATKEQGVYFERVFLPAETREIRLYLQGGADSAVVRGAGPGPIAVRLVGGGSDDRLEDATSRGAGATLFYDDPEDDDEFIRGPETLLDTRVFVRESEDTVTQNNPPPRRDWGTNWKLVAPAFGWESEIGPVLEVGPQWTRYGFRRFPYARQAYLALAVAPLEGRFGVSAELHRIRTGGWGEMRLRAVASQINVTRFHGFGNDSQQGADPDLGLVWATDYTVSAEFTEFLAPRVQTTFGLTATHLEPELQSGSPADEIQAPGTKPFTLGGLTARAAYDGRDSSAFPTKGVYIESRTDWYPLVDGDAPEAFVRTDIVGSVYRPLPLETVLALRGGGETLWGVSPFQYAPTVGGGSTLRGHRTDRFTGDASLFGSVELRTAVGGLDLFVTRGDFGTIALADVGRVFMREGSPSRWHSAFGGGFWFGPLDREFTAHVLLVRGERLDLRAGLGLPF